MSSLERIITIIFFVILPAALMRIGWVLSRYISDFSSLFPNVIYAGLYVILNMLPTVHGVSRANSMEKYLKKGLEQTDSC